jgi:3-isopropylmalate dehydrogenase
MKATILCLPGDGIGPEIMCEARRALEAVAEVFGHDITVAEEKIGGAAIDEFGIPLPPRTLDACRSADAVLLGAVGGPRWDTIDKRLRPEQGLLALRKELGLFANLRPVKVHDTLVSCSAVRPEIARGVDLIFVRELTGGIYFGEKSLNDGPDGQVARDVCSYSVQEIERVVRVAATLARTRRGRVTSVDKANVLETSRLWRTVTDRLMRAEFPDVALEHVLVDACAMHLIRKPAEFDVIVTENMFGDILSDEASMLAGSLGVLPSASLGEPGTVALYEPIHGSAPDIAGQGIANPLGTILSAAMLLRHSFALEEEAAALEEAAFACVEAGMVTADLCAAGERHVSTEDVGRAIATHLTGSKRPYTATARAHQSPGVEREAQSN